MADIPPTDHLAEDPETLSKSLFKSKTLWLNLLAPVFMWATTKYGIRLDPDSQWQLIVLGMMSANIIMRRFTNQPVHVIKAIDGKPSPSAGTIGGLAILLWGMAALVGLASCSQSAAPTVAEVKGDVAGWVSAVDQACASLVPVAADAVQHNTGTVQNLLTWVGPVCNGAHVASGFNPDAGSAAWVGQIVGNLQGAIAIAKAVKGAGH